jgi:hypothetical protein
MIRVSPLQSPDDNCVGVLGCITTHGLRMRHGNENLSEKISARGSRRGAAVVNMCLESACVAETPLSRVLPLQVVQYRIHVRVSQACVLGDVVDVVCSVELGLGLWVLGVADFVYGNVHVQMDV